MTGHLSSCIKSGNKEKADLKAGSCKIMIQIQKDRKKIYLTAEGIRQDTHKTVTVVLPLL